MTHDTYDSGFLNHRFRVGGRNFLTLIFPLPARVRGK